MASSVAALRQEMLAETGAATVQDLFVQVPASHRLKRPLELPAQLTSEAALRRHLVELLARNTSCEDALSFLGAGCYRHHVPAICDEIVGRARMAYVGVGDAVVGPRAVPGVVRVRQPAGGTARPGFRRACPSTAGVVRPAMRCGWRPG